MLNVRIGACTLLVLVLGNVPALAAEADQFTRRFEPPPADSSAEINRRLNELLQFAVDRANQFEKRWPLKSNPARLERRLYREMQKEFNNHIRSDFMRDLIDKDREDDGIDRRRIVKEDSIFAQWKLRDGVFIAVGKADESRLVFSPLIRMGEVTIGVDKLEHLFEQGWDCFAWKYLRGLSTSGVIFLTSLNEKYILGGNRLVTGVYSYADLVANFNGMRFWNDVLQKHDDILGKHENAGPYVIREDDVWKVNSEKPIDLTHYIDWGMDEGINCARYATWRAARKVREALSNLSKGDLNHTYCCPMDVAKLNQITKKYGDFSDRLLNTRGAIRRGVFFGRN